MSEIESDIQRGQRAQQIMESKLWEEADGMVREWTHDKLIEHWSNPEALREIAAFALAHKKYNDFMQEVIENGHIAFHALEAEKNSGEDTP